MIHEPGVDSYRVNITVDEAEDPGITGFGFRGLAASSLQTSFRGPVPARVL